ncbi:MAG TPA: 2-amino-4-hydroxy-6-hydroxymethyldihydropteridine diphosphokinase [Spirillospora sp.]|nr:2-amino-4-hydroxy-6-hydroxymethyldihydropteridine diphosphokinase [Spirillospora sp.]
MTSSEQPAVVYVSLGSNIEPEQHLRQAVQLLRRHCNLLALSAVYRTAPQGYTQQADFLNMAVKLETTLSPSEFKQQVISQIEQQLGRMRDPQNRNAPRTIDLDISLWNNEVLDYGEKPWHIPDPDITRFAHVIVPLAEIAPDYIHPETGQTLAEIARQLDTSAIERQPLDIASGRG